MNSDTSSAIVPEPGTRAVSAAPPRRQIRLTGRSAPVDPDAEAARRDLADIALAGRVFAQHYAVPVAMRAVRATSVRRAPQHDAEISIVLGEGDAFHVLDLARDWAWGRGDTGGSVGYVDTSALVAS